MNKPGTNTGHGHVWARPDGLKAKCGGPGLCAECSRDAAQQDALMDEREAFEDAFRRAHTYPEAADQTTFRKGWEAAIMYSRARYAPAQDAEREMRQDVGDVEAIAYTLIDTDIKIERVMQRDGTFKWAARRPGCCLSTAGEWDWEPLPSSRTDEWLVLHRFDTAQRAIDAARAQRAGKEQA